MILLICTRVHVNRVRDALLSNKHFFNLGHYGIVKSLSNLNVDSVVTLIRKSKLPVLERVKAFLTHC